MQLVPADESAHPAGPDPWWQETWRFELWTAEGDLGAFTSLTVLPHQRRAWYWAELVRPGLPGLHLLELDLHPPRRGLEVRGHAIWADHVCEAPFEQWTVANEAYAVAVDEVDAPLNELRGDPQPVAFDLEWYASGPPDLVAGEGGYRQPGTVNALVELSTGPLRFDAVATRSHTWGPPPPPAPRPLEAAGVASTRVRLEGPEGARWVHRGLRPGQGWVQWQGEPGNPVSRR